MNPSGCSRIRSSSPRNVSLERALEAVAEDRSRDIVELRDYGKERKIEERSLARLHHLYRQKLLGVLLN
jgi:hypothetical protein